MNYQQFRSALADEITHTAEEGIEVSFSRERKNNDIATENLILGSGMYRLLPSVDMHDLYHEHRKGVPVRHLARLVLHEYEMARKKKGVPEDFFRSYDDISSDIYCKLISRERNHELLKEVPHRQWSDLEVICYYRANSDWLKGGVITIRSEHLAYWGISSRKLFSDAWKNTAGMHPVFRKLSSVLMEMENEVWSPGDAGGSVVTAAVPVGAFEEEGMSADDGACRADESMTACDSACGADEDMGACDSACKADEGMGACDSAFRADEGMGSCDSACRADEDMSTCDGENTADISGFMCPLYILTNERKCLGAITIAIPGEAEAIAKSLGSDYFVLPSSIHECLILPDTGSYNRQMLDHMVTAVNSSQVEPEDVLSDHVYHYSRSAGAFD